MELNSSSNHDFSNDDSGEPEVVISGFFERLKKSWRGGSPVGTASVSYAGFGRRAAAYFVDHAILVTFNVTMLVLFVVAMTIMDSDFSLHDWMLHEFYGASIGAWMWTLAEPGFVTSYFIFHWRVFGATPGQWLFDVQVVTMDLDGLSFSQAFLRWIGFLFCTFTAGMGFLWALFDPHQQGLHDKLARTIAVRRSDLEELQLITEAEEELSHEELALLERAVDEYDPLRP